MVVHIFLMSYKLITEYSRIFLNFLFLDFVRQLGQSLSFERMSSDSISGKYFEQLPQPYTTQFN